MIHNPAMLYGGEADELRQNADRLDQFKESVLDIYEANSNLDRETISKMMDEETYISASDALEMGFATAVEEGKVAMRAKSLDEYKMMTKNLSKDLIETKMKKEPKPMANEKEKRNLLTKLCGFLGVEMKAETEQAPAVEESAELTKEIVAQMIDDKLESTNSTMSEIKDIVMKLVPSEEEQVEEEVVEEVQEVEEVEEESAEAVQMCADDIFANLEKLEEAGVTPAARKKAIAEMKAGSFEMSSFIEDKENLKKKKVSIDEDSVQMTAEEAKTEWKNLKGAEKTKFYQEHKNMIMGACSAVVEK